MTIQELINALNRIEDKSLLVAKYNNGDMNGPPFLLMLKGIEMEKKNVYLCHSNKLNQYADIVYLELVYGGLY